MYLANVNHTFPTGRICYCYHILLPNTHGFILDCVLIHLAFNLLVHQAHIILVITNLLCISLILPNPIFIFKCLGYSCIFSIPDVFKSMKNCWDCSVLIGQFRQNWLTKTSHQEHSRSELISIFFCVFLDSFIASLWIESLYFLFTHSI